ncbi:MAG: alpha-E domain-containing protein [Bacteroidales bacterium]|nr:alpha-E domain-containing protein [Bacteroidales bacterium]
METITLTQEKNISTLSKEKASRLYWLGRYTERAYASLHFLRKYHDIMIDGDKNAYILYCSKMGIENKYSSDEDFMKSYLYDSENPDSLSSMLNLANDNAIVLREEITSETLSYIQLSISHLNACAKQNCDMLELQSITDYLLAFWGSIDARIGNASLRCVLKSGKLIEGIDLHIRFDYSFERIFELFVPLHELVSKEKYIFNEEMLKHLHKLMTRSTYQDDKTLESVNGLFYA